MVVVVVVVVTVSGTMCSLVVSVTLFVGGGVSTDSWLGGGEDSLEEPGSSSSEAWLLRSKKYKNKSVSSFLISRLVPAPSVAPSSSSSSLLSPVDLLIRLRDSSS